MGALAATAAMALMPAVALADDGPSVYEFKLPNKAAAEKLIDLGFDLGDGLDQSQPGFVKATIVASDAEKAQLEAMGYPAVNTIQTPADVDALRAARQATIDAENAAKAALDGAGKSTKSAVGTVRAQHADYWEDAGGRWLSIEGTTTEASVTNPCPVVNNRTRCAYDGPELVASWYDADGNQVGTGTLSAYLDTDVTPLPPYLYHVSRFRLGDASTIGTPMPSFIRIAAPNGDVAQMDVKKWVGNGAPQYAAGFQQDFNTHYVDPQEGYKRITDLAALNPDIAQIYDLPNKTPGYQRLSQTVVGMSAAYTGSTSSPAAAEQAKAVVITSKTMGQNGGNSIAIRLVNPGAGEPDIFVSTNPTTKMIRVNLATDAAGAITSTAKQVVDAINADAGASALVTASLYRTNAGDGIVSAGTATSTLSDFLNAPPEYPRGPQTVKMIRIGKQRDGSKVGVFIYCQEHAREWGTPLVCLETAERLIRNYGSDPETTKLIDNLDIFLIPTINADGAAYSMYDYAQPAPQHGQLLRVEPDGQQRSVRPQQLGCRPQPQLQRRLVLRRLPGRLGQLHERRRSPAPPRSPSPRSRNEAYVQSHVPEHQVRHERALLGRLLHVASGCVQAHHA